MATKRNLSSGLLAAVTAPVVSPIFLAYFDFESADLRLWTGAGPLTFGGEVFIGGGNLIGIQPIEETAKTKAAGVSFSLSGLPSDLIALAQDDDYQGRLAQLWIGALDSAGALISDPFLIFQGFMDVMSMSEEGQTANFSMAVENKLISLERPSKHLWTAERQKLDYPDDKGFDDVTELQDKEVVWK